MEDSIPWGGGPNQPWWELLVPIVLLIIGLLLHGCACPGPLPVPEHYRQDSYIGRWPGPCEVFICNGEEKDWCQAYHGEESPLCVGKPES